MIKNLVKIQNELKAPKSNFNSFGKYSYRSTADILTAVKPLLAKYNCQLTITHDIVLIGDRYYVKATSTITDEDGNSETAIAFAREELAKKGMDASQITGACVSYSSKYSLGNLFLIDETQDADTDAYCKKTQEKSKFTKSFLKEHGSERIGSEEIQKLKTACLNAGESMSLERALTACRRSSVEEISNVQYYSLMSQLGATA